MVKDGTIGLADYERLLFRLYGFYAPFEPAARQAPIRTAWLAQDIQWISAAPDALARLPLCPSVPDLDRPGRRLGALYVVEGSALGGRQLSRGLDTLVGANAADGRRFFAGRGADTGGAWLRLLDQVESVRRQPSARSAMIDAAMETFEVFESWLAGWRTSL